MECGFFENRHLLIGVTADLVLKMSHKPYNLKLLDGFWGLVFLFL